MFVDFSVKSKAEDVVSSVLAEVKTNLGRDVLSASNQSPVLLVFLRHMGCTFCREAMADLGKRRVAIEATGTRIIAVHMSEPAYAEKVFVEYPGLTGVEHVSDPTKRLYAAMSLKRGSLRQLFGLKSFLRGFRAGIVDGHLVGRLVGDGFQMPGVFLIHRGQVLRAFRHESAADRPDYDAMACPV